MRVGVLITDGGPHPADKWANETAESIGDLIQVDQTSNTPAAAAARKAKPRFILDMADRLESFHQSHIDHSKVQLATHGNARVNPNLHPYAPNPDILNDAVNAVIECSKGTPFEAHFQNFTTRAAVASIIGSHFSSADHIERSYHVDRHLAAGKGHDEHTQAFHDKFRAPYVPSGPTA